MFGKVWGEYFKSTHMSAASAMRSGLASALALSSLPFHVWVWGRVGEEVKSVLCLHF